MLSGSEDGTICVWKSRSWELLKKLQGHRYWVIFCNIRLFVFLLS